jgi:hypothetical protein
VSLVYIKGRGIALLSRQKDQFHPAVISDLFSISECGVFFYVQKLDKWE